MVPRDCSVKRKRVVVMISQQTPTKKQQALDLVSNKVHTTFLQHLWENIKILVNRWAYFYKTKLPSYLLPK